MKQKIIITGSNGLLGQKLIKLLIKDYTFEIYAISRGENRNNSTDSYHYFDVDLTDFDTVKEVVNQIEPHIIINTAAMTNVDECEDNKSTCDIINVELVNELAQLCKIHKAHLIHISTDFIFDGEDGPYAEDDSPNPLSYYGLSKLKSEEVIVNANIKHTILRTILVYGLVDNMSRNNIVLWVKNSIENKSEVTIIDDQFRMPTFVDDLAEACLLAIQKKAYGVFNVSSSELMSIYDMAVEIAHAFELDTTYIKRISTDQLNQKAKRPPVTGFILDKSIEKLGLPMHTFKERLQVFKNQLLTINS